MQRVAHHHFSELVSCATPTAINTGPQPPTLTTRSLGWRNANKRPANATSERREAQQASADVGPLTLFLRYGEAGFTRRAGGCPPGTSSRNGRTCPGSPPGPGAAPTPPGPNGPPTTPRLGARDSRPGARGAARASAPPRAVRRTGLRAGRGVRHSSTFCAPCSSHAARRASSLRGVSPPRSSDCSSPITNSTKGTGRT